MKRRLVGAVVIVLLAIILVPAWLDGSARRLRDEDGFVVPLPPPDNRQSLVPADSIGTQLDSDLPKLEPLPTPAAAQSASQTPEQAAESAVVELKKITADTSTEPQAPVAAAKPAVPAKPAEPAPVPATPASVVVDLNADANAAQTPKVAVAVSEAQSTETQANWIVQVGSFASQENAKAMVSRLKKGELKAFMRDFKSNGDTIYRVLVGPFVRQTEADDAKRTIDRRFQVKSFVANWRG